VAGAGITGITGVAGGAGAWNRTCPRLGGATMVGIGAKPSTLVVVALGRTLAGIVAGITITPVAVVLYLSVEM